MFVLSILQWAQNQTHNCRIQLEYDQPAADQTRYAKKNIVKKTVYTMRAMTWMQFLCYISFENSLRFLTFFEQYLNFLKIEFLQGF